MNIYRIKMKTMTNAIIFTIITTLLITLGQVFWKLGLNSLGGLFIEDLSLFDNILRLITSIYIILGFIIYAIATIFFMYLLSKYDISLIIPLSSISFVFSLFAGSIFFNEDINIFKIIGVAVIIGGVIILSKS
jgi:uncharacterized membrane protein